MILDKLKSGYQRISQAFAKTGSLLGSSIRKLFGGKIDEKVLEDLEQLFYEADLGASLSSNLTAQVKTWYQQSPGITSNEILEKLQDDLVSRLMAIPTHSTTPINGSPHVILIIGVNGNGKTTSLAKLAKRYKEAGKKVLVVAADTFRAAAVEQLQIWAERLSIDIVKGAQGSDPSAVVFDGLTAAKARSVDIVLIDTAGRLHTKLPLMQELEKINRTCNKVIPGAPHDSFLVLDANNGQNAVDQAQNFNRVVPISGLILTKLDGRAKGGSVIGIQNHLKLPVKYVGIGEGVDDLQPFDPKSFVQTLLQ